MEVLVKFFVYTFCQKFIILENTNMVIGTHRANFNEHEHLYLTITIFEKLWLEYHVLELVHSEEPQKQKQKTEIIDQFI